MADPRPHLQLVELAPETVHPDRAILDRISDPVSRELYRGWIEREERRWREERLGERDGNSGLGAHVLPELLKASESSERLHLVDGVRRQMFLHLIKERLAPLQHAVRHKCFPLISEPRLGCNPVIGLLEGAPLHGQAELSQLVGHSIAGDSHSAPPWLRTMRSILTTSVRTGDMADG